MYSKPHPDQIPLRRQDRSVHNSLQKHFTQIGSYQSKNNASFTPFFLAEDVKKNASMTFELHGLRNFKLTFFKCFHGGKDLFYSSKFMKIMRKEQDKRRRTLSLMRDHSVPGVMHFLTFVCKSLKLERKKAMFFVIRYDSGAFHFENWSMG